MIFSSVLPFLVEKSSTQLSVIDFLNSNAFLTGLLFALLSAIVAMQLSLTSRIDSLKDTLHSEVGKSASENRGLVLSAISNFNSRIDYMNSRVDGVYKVEFSENKDSSV